MQPATSILGLGQALAPQAEPCCPSLRQVLDHGSWLAVRRAAEISVGITEALSLAYLKSGSAYLKLRPDDIYPDAARSSVLIRSPEPCDAKSSDAAYQSPEQIECRETDLRSDFYALGVVLYEMLTDRLPFDGTGEEVRKKHLHRKPERPDVFRAELPVHLSDLVMRLLEKDPAARPQQAADVIAELRTTFLAEDGAHHPDELDELSLDRILAFEEVSSCSQTQTVLDGNGVLDLDDTSYCAENEPVYRVHNVSTHAADDVSAGVSTAGPADTARPLQVSDWFYERRESESRRVPHFESSPLEVGRQSVTGQPVESARRVEVSQRVQRVARGPNFLAATDISSEPRLKWVVFFLIACVVAAELVLYRIGPQLSGPADPVASASHHAVPGEPTSSPAQGSVLEVPGPVVAPDRNPPSARKDTGGRPDHNAIGRSISHNSRTATRVRRGTGAGRKMHTERHPKRNLDQDYYRPWSH